MTQAPERPTWSSPGALAPGQHRFFDDLLFYCLPSAGTAIVEHGPDVTTVHFDEAADWPADRCRELLDLAYRRAAASLAGPRSGEKPAQATRSSQPSAADATPVGPGLTVLGPRMTLLLEALDQVFHDLAARCGAVDYTVPHMVSWPTIERAGYARTFPQHLMACSVVGPDLLALDRFASARTMPDRSAALRTADVVLAPAVCLHLYAALAGQELAQPLVATARGVCSRHEAGTERSPVRLWAFSMREIVYIGERNEARTFRDRVAAATLDLARRLGLPADLVPANDPFFTYERDNLADYQNAFDLKSELSARSADGSPSVAVSSINLHMQHFGHAFDISTANGGAAYSSCVGYGLERWAHWVQGHLGTNPEQWPKLLRQAAEKIPAYPESTG